MKRVSFYLPQEIINLCDSDMNLADARSRNQFVIQAIKLYDCYLHKQVNTDLLTPAFESVVGAKIDLSEYVLAGAFELDDQKVQRMKHRVIREVKELNGWINLEDIIRYQNGEE